MQRFWNYIAELELQIQNMKGRLSIFFKSKFQLLSFINLEKSTQKSWQTNNNSQDLLNVFS